MNRLTNALPKILALVLFLPGAAPAWSQVTVSGQFSPSAEPPGEYALEDVEIGLRRTTCFGTCPAYQVRISGDGTVEFEGTKFVRVVGTEQSTVSKAVVLGILSEVYRIFFFDMRDSYHDGRPGILERGGIVTATGMAVEDVPEAILTVRIGSYEKRVTAIPFFDTPPELIDLMERIDRETDLQQWIE